MIFILVTIGTLALLYHKVHIMLIVVVLLLMVPFVVLSVLVLALLLFLLTGTMALLYKCIHYPLHGGHSYSDTNCGAFLLDIYAFPTRSDWHRGAALE